MFADIPRQLSPVFSDASSPLGNSTKTWLDVAHDKSRTPSKSALSATGNPTGPSGSSNVVRRLYTIYKENDGPQPAHTGKWSEAQAEWEAVTTAQTEHFHTSHNDPDAAEVAWLQQRPSFDSREAQTDSESIEDEDKRRLCWLSSEHAVRAQAQTALHAQAQKRAIQHAKNLAQQTGGVKPAVVTHDASLEAVCQNENRQLTASAVDELRTHQNVKKTSCTPFQTRVNASFEIVAEREARAAEGLAEELEELAADRKRSLEEQDALSTRLTAYRSARNALEHDKSINENRTHELEKELAVFEVIGQTNRAWFELRQEDKDAYRARQREELQSLRRELSALHEEMVEQKQELENLRGENRELTSKIQETWLTRAKMEEEAVAEAAAEKAAAEKATAPKAKVPLPLPMHSVLHSPKAIGHPFALPVDPPRPDRPLNVLLEGTHTPVSVPKPLSPADLRELRDVFDRADASMTNLASDTISNASTTSTCTKVSQATEITDDALASFAAREPVGLGTDRSEESRSSRGRAWTPDGKPQVVESGQMQEDFSARSDDESTDIEDDGIEWQRSHLMAAAEADAGVVGASRSSGVRDWTPDAEPPQAEARAAPEENGRAAPNVARGRREREPCSRNGRAGEPPSGLGLETEGESHLQRWQASLKSASEAATPSIEGGTDDASDGFSVQEDTQTDFQMGAGPVIVGANIFKDLQAVETQEIGANCSDEGSDTYADDFHSTQSASELDEELSELYSDDLESAQSVTSDGSYLENNNSQFSTAAGLPFFAWGESGYKNLDDMTYDEDEISEDADEISEDADAMYSVDGFSDDISDDLSDFDSQSLYISGIGIKQDGSARLYGTAEAYSGISTAGGYSDDETHTDDAPSVCTESSLDGGSINFEDLDANSVDSSDADGYSSFDARKYETDLEPHRDDLVVTSFDIEVTHIKPDIHDRGNTVAESLSQPFARQPHPYASLPGSVHFGIDDLEMPEGHGADGAPDLLIDNSLDNSTIWLETSNDGEDDPSSISIGGADDEGTIVGDRDVEPLAQRNDRSRFGDVHFNISELEDSDCDKDRVCGKAEKTQPSTQKWLNGLGRSEGLDKLEAALEAARAPRLQTVRDPMDTVPGSTQSIAESNYVHDNIFERLHATDSPDDASESDDSREEERDELQERARHLGGLQARINDADRLRASRKLLGAAAASRAKPPRDIDSHANSGGEEVSRLTVTVPDSGKGVSDPEGPTSPSADWAKRLTASIAALQAVITDDWCSSNAATPDAAGVIEPISCETVVSKVEALPSLFSHRSVFRRCSAPTAVALAPSAPFSPVPRTTVPEMAQKPETKPSEEPAGSSTSVAGQTDHLAPLSTQERVGTADAEWERWEEARLAAWRLEGARRAAQVTDTAAQACRTARADSDARFRSEVEGDAAIQTALGELDEALHRVSRDNKLTARQPVCRPGTDAVLAGAVRNNTFLMAYKLGGKNARRWQKRFFMFSGDLLTWYTAATIQLKGTISISNIRRISLEANQLPGKSRKFAFRIHANDSDRAILLAVATEAARAQWMDRLLCTD
jgi:hypothetical protein